MQHDTLHDLIYFSHMFSRFGTTVLTPQVVTMLQGWADPLLQAAQAAHLPAAMGAA